MSALTSVGGVGCPDENMLAAFVGGDLTESACAELQAHLEGCSACGGLVAALMKGAREDAASLSLAETAPAGGPREAGDGARLERVGRYVVLDQLGAGGMGRVHAAFDPVLERKLAIKLVKAGRAGGAGEELQARLLREGKAIAQLNHPNIVAIFDMGLSDGEVYVAMELVEGGSLKAWLGDVPRSPREVLDVYLEAGRGLAAAHRAGLVHRDFKPENVLVGADGRVRVSDFGLSTSVARPAEVPRLSPTADARLTQSGALLGTPAYMAPEQWEGRTASAASDQFSFCLSLWEGLYGVAPFARGRGRPAWQRVEPPAAREVPARVRAALERGLSLEPSRRFASMEALLAALEPRALPRWGLVAAGLLLAAGASGLAAWRAAPRCDGAAALVEAVWRPETAAAVDRALAASPEAAALVKARLTAYLEAWRAMHTEACEATRLRGAQSDQVMTLRMACLERRRAEVKAVVELLVASAPEQVQAAPEATEALPPLSLCANVDGLLAQVAPPQRSDTARAVEGTRDGLARARALMELGRLDEALRAVGEARQQARSIDYPPVLAEALSLEGALAERRGELKPAEALLLEAISVGEASRHDLVRAEAATTLTLVLGVRQARFSEAAAWDKLAEGAIARVGGGPWLEARLLQTRGLVRYAQGQLAEAIELQRRAADAYATLDPGGVYRGLALNELGAAYRGARKATEALAAYQQALELLRARLGDHSDAVAATRNGLANTFMLVGRFDEALVMYLAALEIFEQRLGPTHFRTVTAANNIGVVLAEQERFAEALPYFERVVGARQAQAADPKAADAHANLGMLLLELRRYDEAQRQLELARGLLQGVALDHFSNAEPLLGLARLALERHRGIEAAPLIARVLALCEGKQGFRFDYTRARADFLQARVLLEAQGQRDAGRALAAKVRETLTGFGEERFRRDLAVVRRWEQAH
ncbi:MAG: tetratricopeptide repeat protein [Myxococcaceae bacterium]|nr:tetratricopeptide repeat protein [Myxococcaceae bacterium]